MYGKGVFSLGKILAYVYLVIKISAGVTGRGPLCYEFSVYVKLIVIVGGYLKRCLFKRTEDLLFTEKDVSVGKIFGIRILCDLKLLIEYVYRSYV